MITPHPAVSGAGRRLVHRGAGPCRYRLPPAADRRLRRRAGRRGAAPRLRVRARPPPGARHRGARDRRRALPDARPGAGAGRDRPVRAAGGAPGRGGASARGGRGRTAVRARQGPAVPVHAGEPGRRAPRTRRRGPPSGLRRRVEGRPGRRSRGRLPRGPRRHGASAAARAAPVARRRPAGEGGRGPGVLGRRWTAPGEVVLPDDAARRASPIRARHRRRAVPRGRYDRRPARRDPLRAVARRAARGAAELRQRPGDGRGRPGHPHRGDARTGSACTSTSSRSAAAPRRMRTSATSPATTRGRPARAVPGPRASRSATSPPGVPAGLSLAPVSISYRRRAEEPRWPAGLTARLGLDAFHPRRARALHLQVVDAPDGTVTARPHRPVSSSPGAVRRIAGHLRTLLHDATRTPTGR